MYRTITQVTAGSIGFIVGTVIDASAQAVDAIQPTPILEQPTTYLWGIVVSAILQIVLKFGDKIIDAMIEKKKAKRSKIEDH